MGKTIPPTISGLVAMLLLSSRAFLPHFIARRSGCIVNVTSMMGFMGMFGYSAYAASKYALAGFTECLRRDLIP